MQVVDAFYYTAYDPTMKGRDATFHDYLLHSGYVLRTRPIKGCCDAAREEPPWERVELAVDMTIDILLTLGQYDVCAIFSGDGNFERVVGSAAGTWQARHALRSPGDDGAGATQRHRHPLPRPARDGALYRPHRSCP
jgi:hypothetical protein